ncbi:MAG: 2-C-methyl-D-erythritol 4-phosphate cytidylyltransferase [candidate division Zixibacteria bacterium]|nr:2-C-methyl-D-erythritol 4-phosphate cytidylyltransferase [candidate division Zixibacteria bacterium]
MDDIIVVTAEEYLLYVSENVVDAFGFRKVSKIIIGGESRQESVYKGLKALPISTQFVAIHDGARVLIQPEDINTVVEIAQKEKAAIIASKATDTLKRSKDNFIISTVDRSDIYCAQTPQVFQYDLIMEAHAQAIENNKIDFTDDASLIEQSGFKVKLVEPKGLNIKVTTTEDLQIVEALLKDVK